MIALKNIMSFAAIKLSYFDLYTVISYSGGVVLTSILAARLSLFEVNDEIKNC